MEQAKVFFTDFRCHPGVNQQQKLEKLLLAAGWIRCFEGKIVCHQAAFRRGWQSGISAPELCKDCGGFREGKRRTAIPDRLQHAIYREPEKCA